MKKVLIFSVLLVLGLIGSQILPGALGGAYGPVHEAIRVLTMVCLGFIMIHVGYEFEIDRSRMRSYAVDYGVAATAAAFPWVFCAAYFVFVMYPSAEWGSFESWKQALLAGRFAAPTSAGILFSMLAAAGLAATWTYGKARILAIFDDLDTVLLMIPLKMMFIGLRWELGLIIVIMLVLIWLPWRYLHQLKAPVTWPWVLGYAAAIAIVSEVIYQLSSVLVMNIHIEVLLPAFALGCMLARPAGEDPHKDDMMEGHIPGPESATEQRVSTIISAFFMVLVGLSMPEMSFSAIGGVGTLAIHVLLLTVLSNLGKMFPLFCYRSEATWRERLALCVGMWPRGEVGAGVLIVSISYGLRDDMIAAAALSLALNLVLTGVFIMWVKRLLASNERVVAANG